MKKTAFSNKRKDLKHGLYGVYKKLSGDTMKVQYLSIGTAGTQKEAILLWRLEKIRNKPIQNLGGILVAQIVQI